MRIIIRLPLPHPLASVPARRSVVGLLLIGAMLTATAGQAIDVITKRVGDGTTAAIEGLVISDSGDEYLSILTPNGRMELLGVEQIVGRERDERIFEPLSKKELAAEWLKELPAGFKSYSTKHYLILYEGTTDALLVGSLAERFYHEYFNFWKKQKWELQEPMFPLVVVLFANRESFIKQTESELCGGFYSVTTNRAVLSGPPKAEQKQWKASNPSARGKVLHSATIHILIHECSHQLGYNSGLFLRHRKVPAWVDEGLAGYFAGPPSGLFEDGWAGVGKPHPKVLQRLISGGVEIEELISEDAAFRQGVSSITSYLQAWAVNHFLFRKRPDAYIEYLRALYDDVGSHRRTPRQRAAIFDSIIGDLFELQKEFDKDLRELVAAE